MPKLDGYAATQQIRAAEQDGRRVPIIMLTSEADVGAAGARACARAPTTTSSSRSTRSS